MLDVWGLGERRSKGASNIFLEKRFLRPVWVIRDLCPALFRVWLAGNRCYKEEPPEGTGKRERYWERGGTGHGERGGGATSSGVGHRTLSLQDALWVGMATVIIYVNS